MLRKRIVILSLVMKWITAALIVLCGIVAVYFALDRGWLADTIAQEFTGTRSATMPEGGLFWLMWLLVVANIGISVAILANIYRLFDGFSRGAVFAQRMARSVRGIGAWLMIAALSRFLSHAASSLILTWGNGPGERVLKVGVDTDMIIIALFGVVMLLMGIVMDEALRLDEENRQIV